MKMRVYKIMAFLLFVAASFDISITSGFANYQPEVPKSLKR